MTARHPTLATPKQILGKALEMETHARDFYAEIAVGCSVDFVRELLDKLQSEETRHMRMIQDMMVKLGTV